MRIRCVHAIWANAKGMAWRDLREFDLPMRFSAVFQLFIPITYLRRVSLGYVSHFRLMSLVTSFVNIKVPTKACKTTL